MPSPSQYAGQHGQHAYPALYLYPFNDSFVPKHISLANGQRVKIGRQTNPKTAPAEKNGFFDSKVLSRQHAEIWEEGGKIYIKDVKSSNGTFINGQRLSPEGVESDPYEMTSDDIVEFGIDIVGEDNKTIIHHKVAARAVCIYSDQDVQVAARAEQHQQQHQQQLQLQQQHQQQYGQHALMGAGQPGQNGMQSQFQFVGGAQQRRPGPGPTGQGLSGMGGMGGNMRPPGASGLTFERILHRLQGELQKSRDTGSELHSLSGTINEINDVLGGNIPADVLPYPTSLPPARPSREPSPSRTQEDAPSSPPSNHSHIHEEHHSHDHNHPAGIPELHTLLHRTQASLHEHADKVRALEDALADQESIRKDIQDLRHMIENSRQELLYARDHESERGRQESGLSEPRGGFDHEDDDDISHIRLLDEDEEDDDARSIATIIPHELERVDEEDEEQVAAAERDDVVDEHSYDDDRADPIDPEGERERESDRQRTRERQFEEAEAQLRKQEDLNVGRPRTPEPMSFGMRRENEQQQQQAPPKSPRTRSGTLLAPTSPSSSPTPTTNEILEQVLQQNAQIAAMAKLTSALEAQNAAAQDTITLLQSKITDLEHVLHETRESQEKVSVQLSQITPPKMEEEEEVAVETPQEESQTESSLTKFIMEWKKTVEGQWSTVQEEWREERERLNKAREEWEFRTKSLDNGLDKMNHLHGTTTALVKDVGQQKQELVRIQERVQNQFQQVVSLKFNGDAVKHSGLVTPPSPRSQSSDSGYRRRRKRRSTSRGRTTKSGTGVGRDSANDSGDSSDDDATLANEEGIKDAKLGNGTSVNARSLKESRMATSSSSPPHKTTTTAGASRAYCISTLHVEKVSHFDYEDDDTGSGSSVEEDDDDVEGKSELGNKDRERERVALATPASLTNSTVSDDAVTTPPGTELDPKKSTNRSNAVNLQTAGAVVILAVAAAAVFWKVRPE